MRQFFKRLLLPVAVAAVTQTSVVSAEGIRLLGPSGQVQSTPQYNSEVVRNSQAVAAENQPAQFFGPTTAKDTLWSIATRLRPSPRVSVQQTLLAIYRLNPQAFENQNIHTLIPGSTLRIPSLAQVQSATTEEAVRVMQAHQARLTNETPKPEKTDESSAPAAPNAATATPAKVASTTAQATAAPTGKEADALQKELSSSQTELLALEEKNHRLRLMLSDVQNEVTGLKQQLGDENRIRSEVEKLLQEEKRKREEAARLAPSTMDRLLSNTWLVAGLALIPGVLIALLVVMLLNRRSGKNEDETQILEQPIVTEKPITLGEEPMDMDDDDLKLDEDLFGDSSDISEEALFDDSVTDSKDGDELFSELSDDDIDFDLGDEDGEDLFAGIGDDGDLDADLSASALEDEPAIGLDEMQRTLDAAADDAGSDIFDLSDDDNSSISQDDIEALLAGDGDGEDLDSDSLDQSLLDELLANGESDPTDEEVDFDAFLDDDDATTTDELDLGKGALLDEEHDLDLSDSLASDDELDSLFSNIESQADLETLEKEALDESAFATTAPASDEEELLNKLLDEQVVNTSAPIVEDDSVALLDELLQDPEEAKHAEEDDDLLAKLQAGETLDELLNEETGDLEEDFDLDLSDGSTALLDELIDDDQAPINDLQLSEDPELIEMEQDTPAVQNDAEGVDLFDELLEIEQAAEPEKDEPFDSEHFIDDLISNVPEQDPLLGEFDFSAESEPKTAADDDGFDFNPEIEGTVSNEPEPVANEFGVPQDDDWLIDDEESLEPLESDDAIFDLAEQELPENADRAGLEPVVSETQPQMETLEPQVALDGQESTPEPEAEREEESLLANQTAEESDDEFALDDFDLSDNEPEEVTEAPVESSEPVSSAEPEDEFALDDFDLGDEELPEFTEEDALASVSEEPEELTEARAESSEPVSSTEPEDEFALDDFDLGDEELPEFTEEDALASVASEPGEVVSDSIDDDEFELGDFEVGDEELPEFTEEDVLASVSEEPEELTEAPAESSEPVSSAEPEDEFALDDFDLGDEELPEFTEEDALASVSEEPEELAEAPVELSEPLASAEPEDEFALEDFDLGDEELPEFTEEDALASVSEEPEELTEAPAESSEPVASAAPEDEFALDDFDLGDEELPEFTEEDALASVSEEPEELAEASAELSEPVVSEEPEDEFALDDFDLGDEELPEFTEEDALASVAGEPGEVVSDSIGDDEFELGDFDLGDEELPEFTEEDALASVSEEPEELAEASAELSEPVVSEEPEDEFALEDFDLGDEELPEFTEEDALASVASEPGEVVSDSIDDDEFELGDFEVGDEELPEFTEEDALASVASEPGEVVSDSIDDDEFELGDFEVGDDELPEFTEEDALASVFSEPAVVADESEDDDFSLDTADLDDPLAEPVVTEPEPAEANPVAHSANDIDREYQEQSLNNWLDETPSEQAPFRFDKPIDARTIDSAGMDIDAMLEMGGEDWNGFNLTPEQQAEIPDDVPADEEAVWNSDIQNQSPDVVKENWGQQENIENYEPNKKYMTIDELMAQVEQDDERFNPDDEELKLDVGLSEFPDVIGTISNIDVDLNAEAAGKLDLAKMYVEMNDKKGAIKLLEEAIVDGDDEIRRQAKHLIDVLNGRA
ncbi:FimV/HubP family polar landmark protein [Vibrio porteresiae]|uniref:FimV/HubP family polar landmark protein n=1 Tax=Vibrio porteresiae DSM 19223 TaxID=1123496 RepID=A0ABZ0QCP3_9VIBR|nr:FimV/HubP family polar landmark protein [Vibrio porteresiae]WPC73293.1 FimV/HubP family polar landmark protein [Vibrio porteresiae DSM 19223]